MNSLVLAGTSISIPGLAIADRENKRGKSLGLEVGFAGNKSASQLKEEGKALGLKGAELREHVAASLRGDEATAAWVRHDAMSSAMRSNGFVPVGARSDKKGDVWKFEFRNPGKAPEAKKAELDQARIEEREKMKGALLAAGVPAESIDAALAAL